MKKYRIGKFHSSEKTKETKLWPMQSRKGERWSISKARKEKEALTSFLASQQFLEANFNILGTW